MRTTTAAQYHALPPTAGNGRLPEPAPVRNWTRIAAGAVLVAASALAAALLYAGAGDRQPVLAAARPIELGHVIGPADLTEVRVAADPGVRLVPADQRANLIGQRAATALAPGALLSPDSVGTRPAVPEGASILAAALAPGHYPPALRPGDVVLAVPLAAASATGEQTAGASVPATVVAVETVGEAGRVVVSLAVHPEHAERLAPAAARGDVALAVQAP